MDRTLGNLWKLLYCVEINFKNRRKQQKEKQWIKAGHTKYYIFYLNLKEIINEACDKKYKVMN